MSPFRQVRDALGLTVESGTSQNFCWHYLLLTALADQDDALGPASVTYADPFVEVMYRLKDYEGFAAQQVRTLLNPRVK